MAVSKRLRYEILRRDNHSCTYCGHTAPDVKLTVDHVIPVALGGSDEPSNLTTACSGCNSGKSATPPDAALVESVSDSAAMWAQAIAAAAEVLQEDRAYRERCHAAFDKKWNSFTFAESGEPVPRPADWRQSIDMFIAAQVPGVEVLEAVDIAMASRADDTWRYFCGVVWRTVAKLQEIARSLVECGEI